MRNGKIYISNLGNILEKGNLELCNGGNLTKIIGMIILAFFTCNDSDSDSDCSCDQ